MNSLRIATAIAIFVAARVPADSQQGDPAIFVGRWRILGVAVPDTGVNALSDDDASLMNKQLTFSPDRLTWNQSTPTNDICIKPRFNRIFTPAPIELRPQLRKLGMTHPIAYSVQCQSGSWGPYANPVMFRDVGGDLALPWYDGGLIRLVKY